MRQQDTKGGQRRNEYEHSIRWPKQKEGPSSDAVLAVNVIFAGGMRERGSTSQKTMAAAGSFSRDANLDLNLLITRDFTFIELALSRDHIENFCQIDLGSKLLPQCLLSLYDLKVLKKAFFHHAFLLKIRCVW